MAQLPVSTSFPFNNDGMQTSGTALYPGGPNPVPLSNGGGGVYSSTFTGSTSTFTSVLPIPNQTNIGPSGPIPNQRTISPDESRANRDESNDQPVLRSVQVRPWSTMSTLNNFNNKNLNDRALMSHEYQIIRGDSLFVAVPVYAPSDQDAHKVIAGDIAKVNYLLSLQYRAIQDILKKPGSIVGGPGTNRVVQGVKYQDSLYFIYQKILEDNATIFGIKNFHDRKRTIEAHLGKMSFYDIVHDASLLDSPMNDMPVERQSVSSDESSGSSDSEDESLEQNPSSTVYHSRESRIKRMMTPECAWPSEFDVYTKYMQIYRNRNRNSNPLGQWNLEHNEDELYEEQNLEETNKTIQSCMQDLEDADFSDLFNKLEFYQKKALRTLYRLIMTEFLASQDNYVPWCTAAGVRDMWNFFGIVNNPGTGTRPDPQPDPMSVIINCVIEKEAHVLNRWDADLPPLTKLYWYLGRTGRSGDDPYQFFPWCSKPYTDNENVTKTDGPNPYVFRTFERNGHMINTGDPIFVGSVIYAYRDNISAEKKRVLNGIADPSKGSYVVDYREAYKDKISLTSKSVVIATRC